MIFPGHNAKNSCHGTCCLEVKQLGVTLEEDVILRGVSFHLHCGEMVALIGPNGAGKTSLFQCILGQMPYTGSITFSPAQGGEKRPQIGYVPQSPTFDRGDPVSVLDFFAATISRWPVFLPIPKKLRGQVATCLKRVQGEGLIDKRIGTLSGGELQRVLLALALEPLPQILILDEPLSGVDVEGELQLMELLCELKSHYDLSILFSTHDFSTLERYADKVILLQQEVLKVGPPRAVLHSSAFAEAFHLNTTREGGWSQ